MPLYKVTVTIPFTIKAPNKRCVDILLNKINWKSIFRFKIPTQLTYRTDIRHNRDIREILERGIG